MPHSVRRSSPAARAGVPALLSALLLAAAPRAGAQAVVAPMRSWDEAISGSALEQYGRLLALDSAANRAGMASVRSLTPLQVAALARRTDGHPWASRLAARDSSRVTLRVVRPTARAFVNSGFPFGMNDGPVWTGRGLTTVVEAGLVGTLGPITLRLDPVLFRAENNAFPLFDNGLPDDARFRDGITPDEVDAPQRFGAHAYQRFDLGDSELRVDVFGVSAGFGNARETWGPAVMHPLILGTNAPGFLHGFAGTNRPLPIGIGRIHARVIVGRLEQSPYSPAPDSLRHRLASAAILTFAPAGPFSGLELGVSRFFHRRWESGRIPWDAWRIPIDGLFFKKHRFDVDDPTSPNFTPDNQLGSLFARWAFPRSGFEVYGEYATNDARVDLREVIVEPDHATAYMFGAQRLFRRSADRWDVLRGEIVNARASHLDRVRPQTRFYQHGEFRQGHTNRGQVLGSVAVLGGSGFSLAADRYEPNGLTTLEFHRLGRNSLPNEGAYSRSALDMQYVARATRTRFRRGSDLVYGAGLIFENNRDYRRDSFGVLAQAGFTWGRAPDTAQRREPSTP